MTKLQNNKVAIEFALEYITGADGFKIQGVISTILSEHFSSMTPEWINTHRVPKTYEYVWKRMAPF